MADPAPRRRLRVLGVLGFLSWLHLYLGAVFGIGIVVGFGPYVAMWLRMLEGDTEPTRLDRPFPWLVAVFAVLLPLPWVRRRDWRAATIASLPVVVLPLHHLLRLLLLRQP